MAVEGHHHAARLGVTMKPLRVAILGASFGRHVHAVGFARHEFRGRVMGDRIEGIARISLPPHDKTMDLPWRATRTMGSAYFEPTGTNVP